MLTVLAILDLDLIISNVKSHHLNTILVSWFVGLLYDSVCASVCGERVSESVCVCVCVCFKYCQSGSHVGAAAAAFIDRRTYPS